MSDDETVLVTKQSQVYHTTDDCPRIRGHTREWQREVAESWGRSKCQYCNETFAPKPCGEQTSSKLAKMDPEDLGLSPIGEREVAHD